MNAAVTRLSTRFIQAAVALSLFLPRVGIASDDSIPTRLPREMLIQKRWEPISLSLAAFGQLTLTADTIRWQAARAFDYRVMGVRDDGSALLRLTSQQLPVFDGVSYRFVRLRNDDEGKHLVISLYKEGDDTDGNGAVSCTYFKPKAYTAPIGKRGLAGWTGGTKSVRAAWYYNWWSGPDPAAGQAAQFVPMIKRVKDVTDWNLDHILRLKESNGVTCLLGFNEPERENQGNVTVAQAVQLWPRLMATGLRLGSPAPSADAAGMKWLDQFMAQANQNRLRIDFITIHWYQDTAAPTAPENFIRWLNSIHNRYQRPIWITEFAGINWDREHPRITTELNQRFMMKVLPAMEHLDFVERYAWFSAAGEADLFSDTNRWTLTSLGETYRSIGGVSPLASERADSTEAYGH